MLVNEIIYYNWQILQKKLDLLEINFFCIIPLHLKRLQLRPFLSYTLKFFWKLPFLPKVFLKSFILDPPFLIAFKRTFFEFIMIFLQSFSFNRATLLFGFILLKNKISFAYIFPIPETKF